MVRTIKPPHHQNHEEEYEDAEDVAAGTDTSSHRGFFFSFLFNYGNVNCDVFDSIRLNCVELVK